MNNTGEVLFSDLSGDDLRKPTEIESLCVNCGNNGLTKLLLTKIPHYKEVILMSFSCDECGFSNNEIQSGGVIQEKGVRLELTVKTQRDLSRQVVKSDFASVCVPDIQLEIPPMSQKGEITTVEGILTRTLTGLEQDQPVRKHMDPDGYQQIEEFAQKIKNLLEMENEFRIVIEDPSGNSFIENPSAPSADPSKVEKYFVRDKTQDHMLGLFTEEELKTEEDLAQELNEEVKPLDEKALKEEVLHFPTNCPDCNAPAETNMKVTSIPFFKEVVIMATNCEACGHKTNEVKSGGGIEATGKKISLNVVDETDLNRDVLKSETCAIEIPELEFVMGGACLGGRFTTVEGLMNNMLEEIEKNSIWGSGDAAAPDVENKMEVFKARLVALKAGGEPFTLVLDDPAGNSYLQNVYAPDDDPEMKIEEYERTEEQNDDLGLTHMKTENYGEQELDNGIDDNSSSPEK